MSSVLVFVPFYKECFRNSFMVKGNITFIVERTLCWFLIHTFAIVLGFLLIVFVTGTTQTQWVWRISVSIQHYEHMYSYNPIVRLSSFCIKNRLLKLSNMFEFTFSRKWMLIKKQEGNVSVAERKWRSMSVQ